MTAVRDEIVTRLAEDRDAWAGLLADVPRDRVGEPGPMGDWSFHDLVSHLNRWRRRTIGRLEAAVAGEPRPGNPWPAGMDEDDPINAWFRDLDADRPTDELLREYEESFARMTSLIERLPADAFLEEAADSPGYFRWRDGSGELTSDFTGHLADHADDVRAWLARG